MCTLRVVEDLDVLEDVGARSCSRIEGALAHELLLQRREEALGDGVVPAVALAAHALAHAVGLRIRDPAPPSARFPRRDRRHGEDALHEGAACRARAARALEAASDRRE